MGNCAKRRATPIGVITAKPFRFLVQKANSAAADSQFGYLGELARLRFPSAEVAATAIATNDPNFFEVAIGNEKVFSSAVSGPLQRSANELIEQTRRVLRV